MIGNRALVTNLDPKGKTKLADKWESTISIVVDRPIRKFQYLQSNLSLEMVGTGTSIETCCFKFLFLWTWQTVQWMRRTNLLLPRGVAGRCTETSVYDEEFDWENGSQAQG